MFSKYERVASDANVKTHAQFNPPQGCTHVEIQADTQAVRYTMDGITNPTASLGMLFLTTEPPRTFLYEDFRRIKFTQGAGGAGALNAHYVTNDRGI